MYSINSYLECVPVAVADNDTIPDSALKASTFYNTYYHPYHGRLNETRGRGRGVLRLNLIEQITSKSIWVQSCLFVLWLHREH